MNGVKGIILCFQVDEKNFELNLLYVFVYSKRNMFYTEIPTCKG